MKLGKKIITVLLIWCMCYNVAIITFAEENSVNAETSETSMEKIDALLMASLYLNSSDITEDILVSDSIVKEVIPLYNEISDIVAWYVTFEPTGYAVINNNKNNPIAIEFGQGSKKAIEDILCEISSPHIIYNNPTDIYEENNSIETYNLKNDLYDFYPNLVVEDKNVALQLQQLKTRIFSEISLYGDDDYGFIHWEDMPEGAYTSNLISNTLNTEWATTGEFESIADNHCGAVAATNLALYFSNRGYTKLKINSVYDTFVAVHNFVGNGPVANINNKTKEYFASRGYTLNSTYLSLYSHIKAAIDENRPCSLLLADGIANWHWVIGIGYRQYNAGGSYVRIIDGWEKSSTNFYLYNTGSSFMDGYKYWVN